MIQQRGRNQATSACSKRPPCSRESRESNIIRGDGTMKNVISILMSAVLLMGTAFATDVTFQGVKVADAKGKQTDAQLVFSDIQKKVIINVAGREFLTVPYESIDKVSYEYTKKHRVTQGAIVMVASLGAGAIVMLTKSKSHWLYIDFDEQGSPISVVLRMDKNEYKQI